MSTEIFTGTPKELKVRLDAIILGNTLNDVVVLSKGVYLILFT